MRHPDMSPDELHAYARKRTGDYFRLQGGAMTPEKKAEYLQETEQTASDEEMESAFWDAWTAARVALVRSGEGEFTDRITLWRRK